MGNKNLEEFMSEFISESAKESLSEEEKEFEKYCKLFRERFGRNAYIAEPSGTMQKTIEAIKRCLEEDKDILDDLLFPNRYKWEKDELKIVKCQCELCVYNNREDINICEQYPNGKEKDIIENNIKCSKLKRDLIILY